MADSFGGTFRRKRRRVSHTDTGVSFMQSFFDKRMGAGWKISFVVSVLVFVINVWSDVSGYSGMNGEELFLNSLLLTIWLTARWLAIGKKPKEESAE